MRPPRLQTSRLLLREWRDEDLEPFVALNDDAEVTRFLRGGNGYTREDSLERFAHMRDHWAERGYGLFATELRSTGSFIGFVGVEDPVFLPEVMPSVEIGWRLARDVWGQGLATEAATEVLRWSFEELGLDRIVSVIHPDNTASIRVAEKLGMHRWLDTVHPAYGHGLVVFESFAPGGKQESSTE
jgi:RimJ/RimL family protein N-acetyltransferase